MNWNRNWKNNNEIVITVRVSNLLFATSDRQHLNGAGLLALTPGDVERITDHVIPSRKEERPLFRALQNYEKNIRILLSSLIILVRRYRERDRNGTNNEGQHGWGISQAKESNPTNNKTEIINKRIVLEGKR